MQRLKTRERNNEDESEEKKCMHKHKVTVSRGTCFRSKAKSLKDEIGDQVCLLLNLKVIIADTSEMKRNKIVGIV